MENQSGLISLDEARRIFFLENSSFQPQREQVKILDSLNRVLAIDIRSPINLPPFSRSAMDGYAVKSKDTLPASQEQPVTLRLIGEVAMGSKTDISVHHGEAALIHTGGMIPDGADSVIILENTSRKKSIFVEVQTPVNAGENVLEKGEDVKTGDFLVGEGKRIIVEDIAGFLGIGMTDIEVYKSPVIAVLSSGDEVIPPGKVLQPGQIYDINTGALSAFIRKHGGVPKSYPIISDNPSELERIAKKALNDADAVVFTAGSSASERDITAEIIAKLGAQGVLVHGIAVRPGKPTILAKCNEKPVIGLPGNPVSALVIARLFLKPLIHRLTGLNQPAIEPELVGKLSKPVSSDPTKDEFFPVKISIREGTCWVEPVFFKSNFIFNLTRSDGLLRVPIGVSDQAKGCNVSVMLF